MTTIISLCGCKQSGKTTSLNYLHGYLLKENLVIDNFEITDLGQLKVPALFRDENGNPVKEMGILDLQQRSEEFEAFAAYRIWPIIKGYNFADTLKEVCIGVLGLDYEQCYGTDEQKNTLTKLRWENMPGVLTLSDVKESLENQDWWNNGLTCHNMASYLQFHEPGPMTAREVLQYVGTDIFRKMYNDVWIDSVFNQIEADGPAVAVIGDCRFRNEVEAIKQRGGLVVRLLRNSDTTDGHASENDLNNYDGFDYVIDNRNLSIHESNLEFLKFLVNKGIVKTKAF